MSAALVSHLEAKGVRLEASSKLTFQSASPLDAETVDTLKANRDDLLTYLQDYSSLYSQALALMDRHGVLIVDCGTYAFTLYHCDPKRLVEARLTYPWGVIGTTGNKALMKWGTPPDCAYEGWTQ